MSSILTETISNKRAKLVLEVSAGIPWHLFVDGNDIGEWTNCRKWECGIEGDAGGKTYRIDAVSK